MQQMQNFKYQLVIQGPILSVGRSGSSYMSYNPAMPNENIVHFDCRETIKHVLTNYASLFEKIVVATWEDEQIEAEELTTWGNCKLIKLKNLDQTYIDPKHPTGQINLMRQFYGILKGMEELDLSADEDTYVIKIRTDQDVDLNRMIAEHQKSSSDNQKKIAISFFTKNEISDFYFLAPAQKLERFCKDVLSVQEIPQIDIVKSTVHKVMIQAPFYQRYSKKRDLTNFFYLKSFEPKFANLGFTLYNCTPAKEITSFVEEEFTSFSLELLHGTLWRGDLIAPHPNQAICVNKEFTNDRVLNAFNYFIFQTPKTYFTQKGKITIKALLGMISFLMIKYSPVSLRKKLLARYIVNE